MRVVKSAVSKPKRMALLRRSGGSNLFHFTASQEIFDRANHIIKMKGVAPTWDDLITDPQISEPVRERAAKVKSKPITKIKTLKDSADRLQEFARIRFAADTAKEIAQAITDDTISADELHLMLARGAQKARKVSEEETFRHIGDGKKAKRTGKDIVRGLMKRNDRLFIPTGLRSFDERSRGFIRTAFISMAGQSGGGKTTLADTIRVNQAQNGARSCYWSLEMDHDEMEMRLIARLTDIPMDRLIYPEKLTKAEKRKIITAYDEYATRIIDNGGFTTEAVPRGGVSMQDVLEQSEPFSYDTIFIDYMTLLEDANSEEQWKALGQAGQQAKVFARSHNCAVVLLAQLSEDEKIRYARSIKEHCVAGGSFVDTAEGLIKIEDLAAQYKSHIPFSIGVHTKDGERRTSHAHNNGVKTVYELTTESGYKIKATEDHKFWTRRKDGSNDWVKLSDLNGDDMVVINASKDWPTKIVQLPQMQLAEGKQSRGRAYAVKSSKLPTRMSLPMARLVGYILGDGCISDTRLTFTNKDEEIIQDFVRCFELVFGFAPPVRKQKAGYSQISCYQANVIQRFKSIPGVFGKSHEKYFPDEIMRSSRHVVGQCLGAYYDCDGHASTDRRTVTSVSEEMLRRMQLLLLKAGVYSKLIHQTLPGKNHRDRYVLETAGIQNLEAWAGFVKCVHPRKSKRHKTAWKKYNRDYTLQRVVSIVKKGREKVYDLTVPETHSFVANGIVVHNCNNMWTWMYGEREKETHIVKVTQQKSRNQPMYDFYLKENFPMSRFEDPTEEDMRNYQKSQTRAVGQRSSLTDYRRNKSGGSYRQPTRRA